MSIFINYLIIIMNFILEEIKKKQLQQRAKNFGNQRNQSQQKPPPNNTKPPFQNQFHPNPSTQNPNTRTPQQQQPPFRQNQTSRNPSPQYQQPNFQSQQTQKYTSQHSPNPISNYAQNNQGGFTPQNIRINIQQYPKQDKNTNFNHNFQQNQNFNGNTPRPHNTDNDNYHQNYQKNSNNFGNRYNQNYMQDTQGQQGQQGQHKNRLQSQGPTGNNYSQSPSHRPNHQQQHSPQNQFPRPEQQQNFQQKFQQSNQYQQHQSQGFQSQQQYQLNKPPYQQKQDYQRQDQFEQNQYQTQRPPKQKQYPYHGQGQDYQQQGSSPQGNYRGRGRGRGRGNRGRGGQFGGNNRDEIVDNRIMSDQQAQQRAKKFIHHNQPAKLKPTQKITPQPQQSRQKSPSKNKRKSQISQEQSMKSSQKMQQDGQDEYSQQEGGSQYQQGYEEEQEGGSGDYHSSQIQQEQSEQEFVDDEEEDEDQQQHYSVMEDSQPQKVKAVPKKIRHQSEGSKQSLKMCSQKQFTNRMKIFMQNNNDKIESDGPNLKVVNNNLNLDTSKSFSIFELNKKTYLPDAELALKKFQRSANRADDDNDVAENEAVYIPRSKGGLIKTMEHIKAEILDADSKSADQLIFPVPPGQKRLEFIQIYVFLWDRMREMIKDITRLHEESKHDSAVIQMCEQITRFFILSINQGRKKYKNQLDFDDKMNKESLVKIMTPLLGIYADSKQRLNQLIKRMEEQAQKSQNHQQITVEQVMNRMEEQGIYISPNEPEITSYAILFSVDYRKYLYENIFLGLDLQDFNPLYESKEIQQVLSIKSALSLRNYSKYFDMIENQDFQYLLSCLMVLNIDQIRKEMSENLLGSFKHLQDGTVKRGIGANYLKNSLRFENQQEYEFKKFLRSIKGSIKNDFVVRDQDLPQSQEIYKSPPYAIDFKLKRKYFLQADDKKDRNMKRSDIVSRSWKRSTYVEELISCFLHRDYVPIAKSPSISKQTTQNGRKKQVDKNKPQVRGQQQNPTVPTSSALSKADLLNSAPKLSKSELLNAKIANVKQKVQRSKFLQTFASKLVEIFRPDQSKEQKKLKAAKDIFNIFIKQHEYLLATSFKAFESLAFDQMQKQLVLIRMHNYNQLKHYYIEGFKKQPRPQQTKFSPFGLSNLLQRGKTQQSSYMSNKKPGLNLGKLLKKNKIKQFNIMIIVDMREYEPKYWQIERILRNLIIYLLGSIQVSSQRIAAKNYVYIQKDLTVRLAIQNVAQFQISQQASVKSLLGIDSLIYIQTKAPTTQFSAILSKYFSIQNSVRQSSVLSLPVAVIKILNSNQYVKFDDISFPPEFQCFQFMKTSAIEITASLNLGLIGFMNVSVGKYRFRPKIQVKTMSHLLNLMSSNSHLVKNILTPQLNTQTVFLYYQQYYNLCIEKVLKLSKLYYHSPAIFTNWFKLLQEVYNEPVPLNKIQSTMSRQYVQLDNLLLALKIVSPYETDREKVIFTRTDFIAHYTIYVKKFDQASIITNQQIVKLVQILKIGDNNKLSGNIEQFYQELFKILADLLKEFNIICAQNFKFYLAKEQLYKEVSIVFDKIQQKVNKQGQRIRHIQIQNYRPFILGSNNNNPQNQNGQIHNQMVNNRPPIHPTNPNNGASTNSTNINTNINTNNVRIPNLNINAYTQSNKNKRGRQRQEFRYERSAWIEEVKKKLKID